MRASDRCSHPLCGLPAGGCATNGGRTERFVDCPCPPAEMTTPDKREDVEGLIERLTRLTADAPTMISRETLNETTSLLEELRQAREGRDAARMQVHVFISERNEANAELRGRVAQLREVEQIAGRALGYPWFKDDQKNFPGATEADGVCIGEHVAETIVEELAARALKAEEQRKALMDALRSIVGWAGDDLPEHLYQSARAALSEDADQPLLKTEGEGA